MSTDLTVIIPSRSRPQSVARMAAYWGNAKAKAVWAIDNDDPYCRDYIDELAKIGRWGQTSPFSVLISPEWRPMVHKLDRAANLLLGTCSHIGFFGDDHLPRTKDWDQLLLAAAGTGPAMVWGDDTIQGPKLPTHWVVNAGWVEALGRMVPAPVEHLYCDNSMFDLARAAGIARYVPNVIIEHKHPVAGKADWDDQYRMVNSDSQYVRDCAAYQQWRKSMAFNDQIRAVLSG